MRHVIPRWTKCRTPWGLLVTFCDLLVNFDDLLVTFAVLLVNFTLLLVKPVPQPSLLAHETCNTQAEEVWKLVPDALVFTRHYLLFTRQL